MAAERIQAKEDRVQDQDNGTESQTELRARTIGAVEPQSFPGIVSQDGHEDDCEVQKIAVNVLKEQGPVALAPVGLARLADGAGDRICPPRFVIRAAIVIAGEA